MFSSESRLSTPPVTNSAVRTGKGRFSCVPFGFISLPIRGWLGDRKGFSATTHFDRLAWPEITCQFGFASLPKWVQSFAASEIG